MTQEHKDLLFKALCNYVYYGIEIQTGKNNKLPLTIEAWDKCSTHGESIGIEDVRIGYLKPLLRPLSKLDELIEHNGETFIPISFFEIGDDDNYSYEFDNGNIKLIKDLEFILNSNDHHDILFLPFEVVNKLLEWHFDIYGLLELNLAIEKKD